MVDGMRAKADPGACFVGLAAALCLGLLGCATADAALCEELLSLQLPDVRIVSAEEQGAGPFAELAGRGAEMATLPTFCRVAAGV